MPALTRRFLATAAGFLLIGVLLGLALLVRREVGGQWPTRGLISAHTHLILVGTVMELIIGVAWWFFPRPLTGQPPASERAAATSWWALTLGTMLRAVGEAIAMGRTGTVWATVIVSGGALQVLGLAAAVVALSRRVRPGARG